jgi:hypothetical protein
MSTTTLRTSKPAATPSAAFVILWWGTDIRVLGLDGALASRCLVEREDPVAAIVAMVSGIAPAGTCARIAYHPSSIEIHDTRCPVLGRTRLFRHLSREYASMKAKGALWAIDPPKGRTAGAGSVLYVDVHSALPRLVDGLARMGIHTVGAWPLRCLVDATGSTCRGGEPSWAVLAIPGRALVISAGPHGGQFAHHHEGVGAEEDAVADVNTALALLEGAEGAPGLCAVEEGGGMEDLCRLLAGCKTVRTTLAGLLGSAGALTPGGPSDFLQVRTRYQARRCLAALAGAFGVLMLAGSAWSIRSTCMHREEIRQREVAAAGLRSQLHASVESRRALNDAILRRERELAQMEVGRQREYDLLMALSGLIPRQVELLELSTLAGNFTIRGRCETGTASPGDILARFRRDLGFKDAPWSLSVEPAGDPGPDFEWHGSFQ